jgi:hypothetical protein
VKGSQVQILSFRPTFFIYYQRFSGNFSDKERKNLKRISSFRLFYRENDWGIGPKGKLNKKQVTANLGSEIGLIFARVLE